MFFRDTMRIDPAYRLILAENQLDQVEHILNRLGDHLAAWSRTSDTIRCDLPQQNTSLFIKRYHYPRWKQRLQAMFRGTFFRHSRARSEFHVLGLMRKLGIQGVRPVAFGERRIFHFVRTCFLITEAVPDCMSLSAFIKNFSRFRTGVQAVHFRREILSSLARQVRHMHQAGFFHRDLFWRNVLIRSLPRDRFEFYFVDASVGKRIRIKQRRRDSIVQDIAALSALAPDFCSKADQMRFLLQYLDIPKLDAESRQWLRRVQRESNLLRDTELRRLQRGEVFEPALVEKAQVA